MTFSDPDFVESGRDAVYYVRVVQEPTETVNLDNVRCQDPDCRQIAPCYGDWRTPAVDDCLAPGGERAWSSPIFLQHGGRIAPR